MAENNSSDFMRIVNTAKAKQMGMTLEEYEKALNQSNDLSATIDVDTYDNDAQLRQFADYDVSFNPDMLNGENASDVKTFLRTNAFTALLHTLATWKAEHTTDHDAQAREVIDAFSNYVNSDTFKGRERTSKKDIELALDVLEVCGVNVDSQRENLQESWGANSN